MAGEAARGEAVGEGMAGAGMSKDIPIIFSAPMVRALLEGRKTMTRRILKPSMPTAPGMDNVHPDHVARHDFPYFDAYCSERKTAENPRGMSRNWCWWTRDDRQCLPTVNVKYAPGDRLWVRENLCRRQGEFLGIKQDVIEARYSADETEVLNKHGFNLLPWWRSKGDLPSIHMPRNISRLTLIVTGVKVERLYHIGDDDIRAEGIEDTSTSWLNAWRELWESVNGPGDWETNPFVVAITFRVIKANIDAEAARVAA